MKNTFFRHTMSITAVITLLFVAGCGDRVSLSDEIHTILLSDNVRLEMIRVEAGSFTMSAKDGENEPDEVPHHAKLSKDYYIGRTEVTQAQWMAIMGSNPSEFMGDDLPVENVTWNDAMEFCEKMNDMERAPKGWKFTLPTETQWEYAARGGNRSNNYKYSGSDEVDEVAWYYQNSGDSRLNGLSFADEVISNHCKTHPVAQKKANELGLHDMSGNVFEWCLDDWKQDNSKQRAEFTRGNESGGSRRVFRGGVWLGHASFCRSASRFSRLPGDVSCYLGFRVVLVPVQ